MSKQVDFLVKLRDAAQMMADATNEYLESLAPTEVKGDKSGHAGVSETTFSILSFEPQKGEKLGDFETASSKNNIPDKWNQAFNILKQNNSSINVRYHGQGYQFSYWIYGDRIFRQKLKPKA
jgi:hypothetical protein